MFPSFELFGKEIGLYGILSIIGLFVAGIFAMRMAKKRGLDDNDMLILLLFSAIGVFIGGHLLYGITNIDYIVYFIQHSENIHSFTDVWNRFLYVFGGQVFYGGLLGGIAAGFIYLRKAKLDIGAFTDIAAPTVPLFHAFGRVGCFFGGCCYGIESRFGFTMTRSAVPEANFVTRFPVQLLEALCNLILFVVLLILLRKGFAKGRLFLVYLLSYSVLRFSLEFLRGDTLRGFLWIFSTSQWISLGIFITCILLLVFKKPKIKEKPEISTEKPA